MVLPQGLPAAIQEKKRAALLSIGSAALLLCLKTFLVIRTDSLGILSEALHSGLDLVAAALHSSTDVWSAIVVILGVALVWAGNVWNLPWLAFADSLAGLAVAGVILWVGSQLGRRTLDALLDAAPAGLQDQLVTEVGNIDGVLRVERVRLRRAGNRYFVDATVSVARTANLEQVHAITDT